MNNSRNPTASESARRGALPNSKRIVPQAVMIEIPVGAELPTGSDPRGGEMVLNTRLGPRVGSYLQRLYIELHCQSVRLENGRHVDSVNDAVRWMLEQFGTGLEELGAA